MNEKEKQFDSEEKNINIKKEKEIDMGSFVVEIPEQGAQRVLEEDAEVELIPEEEIDIEQIPEKDKEVSDYEEIGQVEDNAIEQESVDDFSEKISREFEKIEKTYSQIKENKKSDNKENILQNPIEVEVINGDEYIVEYVPKEDIDPAFGYVRRNKIKIRQDLSPHVKRFVKAHELYHCKDKSTWGGKLGREIRANLIPGLKDPIGLAVTIYKTITNSDRIKFYLKLFKGERKNNK